MTPPDRTTYLNALIGRPWTREAHCWALVRQVESDLFGRELPFVAADILDAGPRGLADAFASNAEHAKWQQVYAPKDGAVALMARRNADIHCGVFLDSPSPGILHCDEAQGVRFDPLVILGLTWGRIRYYEPI